jgi:triphosphoribosyl-dephospho-CoA synthase
MIVADRAPSALREVSPRPSHISSARKISETAHDCLILELETWPKPGLVSHVDAGSHRDMNANTLRASAAAITPCFAALAEAGARGCRMERLRIIGLEAELAMLEATHGVNTHRGAIFGLGLLCAAAGARTGGWVDPGLSLGAVVSLLWGDRILDGPVLLHSHGQAARRRYGAGGARVEAALGFPSVYGLGLPALRIAARKALDDPEAARVEACFKLIANAEDTNLLHRGGRAGLSFARAAAQRFLDDGGVGQPDWRERARSVHESFVARWLSPGGSADLLAMTLFVHARQGGVI